MCACRQKKSFLIEDILRDTTKKKPYKPLSNEPTKPLYCRKETSESKKEEEHNNKVEDLSKAPAQNEYLSKFSESEQHRIQQNKVNLETRRNTYPLYPTAVKPGYPWNYRKELGYLGPRQFSYYSDPILNTSLMRSQLASRYASHPLSLRQAYGYDRVGANCCSGWWSLGGRRKGGQVRFTAAQTGALERRFGASKYLSPDERRALATTLRLSDRQVKTWFQNRRAKWRRAAPDCADAESPTSADEGSDDDVHITDP